MCWHPSDSGVLRLKNITPHPVQICPASSHAQLWVWLKAGQAQLHCVLAQRQHGCPWPYMYGFNSARP